MKSLTRTSCCGLLLLFYATSARGQIPTSGLQSPGMASYDSMIIGMMNRYHMPGAAVAVVRDGKLVYARGFGWSNVQQKTVMRPDALFRIASVTKPITATAVMTLVESGQLSLDAHVLPYLDDIPAPPSRRMDPRWRDITIRQLLNHSGGWNRDKSFDPMFGKGDVPGRISPRERPANVESIIHYMKGMPLDFDPGTSHAYSNFGYALLGHVIERISDMPYAEYVRANILEPAGIERMQLGHTRESARLPDEVSYYFPGHPLRYPLVRSIFPSDEEMVPEAYGGFYLEPMAAHGGWVASTIDLLRFMNVVDRRPGVPDILARASVDAMLYHDTRAYPATDVWYGLGWGVRPVGADSNYWHDGSLPGTTSLLVRAYNNTSWAVLFNAGDSGRFMSELDDGMWTAMRGVTAWPDVDLFPSFSPMRKDHGCDKARNPAAGVRC